MARVASSGNDISINGVQSTIGSPAATNLNQLRSGTNVGFTPNSGEISLGHMYGAFTLGPSQISSTTTVNTSTIGVTSSAPNPNSGGVNPGQGTYINWPGTNGNYQASYPSTGDNIRFYARILPYIAPWAGSFENSASNALGVSMAPSSWPGSLSFTTGVWCVTQNTGTYFCHYAPAIETIQSTSNTHGIAVVSGTQYWAIWNSSQFKTGTYSMVDGLAMFGIGSFGRNGQQNHYFRFGGTGITSLNMNYGELIYRGFGYNHDSTGIGPGHHYSPNNFAFLKNTPGVNFPASHSGPGGTTVHG